jgi:hypothetical protein
MHAAPHAPQFAGSTARLTHADPPQVSHPPASDPASAWGSAAIQSFTHAISASVRPPEGGIRAPHAGAADAIFS